MDAVSAPPGTGYATDVVNAMSVDVEDYYQVLNFQRKIDRSEWDRFESRVEQNTDAILQAFSDAAVKGTFFMLGCVAERHPALARRIVDGGHELASHGWSHAPLTSLTEEAARDEMVRSKALLEDLGGVEVLGFRAPSFSIIKGTSWALDALLEAGYRYDSSVFPVRHPDYGVPDAEEGIHHLRAPSGRTMVEFPMTVARFFGRPVPVAGGGYFRLLPYGVTRWGLRQVNRKGRPGVFYLHPWEVDPDQPDLRDRASRIGAFRHYTGLKRTAARLRLLLADFRFTSLRDVLAARGFL